MEKIFEMVRHAASLLPTNIKVLFGLLLIGLAVMATADLVADIKIKRLENATAKEVKTANEAIVRAQSAESTANEMKHRSDELKAGLDELAEIARRQDEEIKIAIGNTNDARGNAERARNIGSIKTTAAELCDKLAKLGHPC